MKRVFLLSPFQDGQTGLYIYNAFKELGWAIAKYDYREILKKTNVEKLNEHLIETFDKLDPLPNMVLVIKGLEIGTKAIDYFKTKGVPVYCWIFDATLMGKPLPECEFYAEMMNHYDTFYTYCNNVKELKASGYKNPKMLAEGYSEVYNGELVLNDFIKKKFGSDIAFIGTIDNIHPEREDYLERIIDEGFDIKIYGETKKEISFKMEEKHQKIVIINEYHSYVCQTSKIIIGGLDSDFMVDESHSARVYRTLAAGGFYLCRHTKGIEKSFTPGIHLVTFTDKEDMIEKIIYYLNNPEEREKIARAGREKVKEYTFEKRIEKEFGK